MHLCLYIRIYVGGPTDGQADSRSLGLVEHLKRISVGSAWNILGKNKNTFYSSLPGCWLYLPWKDSVVGWRLKVRHREWKQRSCQPSLQCHYLACIFLYLVMTWNFLKLAIHASGFFFFFPASRFNKNHWPDLLIHTFRWMGKSSLLYHCLLWQQDSSSIRIHWSILQPIDCKH